MGKQGLIIAASAGADISWIDWTVIVVYVVGIVALGCWAGWRRKSTEGSGYFLADKSLTWPIIGLALFSTNISTIHLVSLAQAGHDTGLAMGNFEWMAAFTLIALSLFFAPFYIRSKVATLPDFLEKRYCRPCRDWFAGISILSAVFIHLGFSLYTGAIVLEGFLLEGVVENPERFRIVTTIAIASLTALYTIIGGLMAVVLTESIQTIVLLIGAICITVFGFLELGGWDFLAGWESLQATMADLVRENADDPELVSKYSEHLSVIRPHGDTSDLPWYSILLGYPVLGLWYWCADQTIVQRVLGAKDENHARIGPLFAGFIKILPLFIFVLPGTICLALIHQGKLPALPLNAAGEPDSEQTLSLMITNLLPVGLKGLMAAALLAALMSTVSGALNSIATLFSYDLFKRWKPDTSDRSLVTIGRVVTFVAMCAAIAWSPQIGRFESVFEGINKVIGYIAPPVTALFIWGIFWRRISSTAALTTAWFGTLLGMVVFCFDFLGYLEHYEKMFGFHIPFLMIPVYTFIACSIVLVLCSYSRKATIALGVVGLIYGLAAVGDVWVTELDWLRDPSGGYFPYAAWMLVPSFLVATSSVVLLFVCTLVYPQPVSEEADKLVWKSPLEPLRGDSWPGIGNYRLVAAALFVVMAALYWAFA